jgi:hypothetical protein
MGVACFVCKNFRHKDTESGGYKYCEATGEKFSPDFPPREKCPLFEKIGVY